MRTIRLLLPIIALFTALTVPAQSETLTNAEIIEMTKAGLPTEIVLRKLRTANTKFDISASGLIGLKNASVPTEVITAMLDRQEILPPNGEDRQHAGIFRKWFNSERVRVIDGCCSG